MRAEFKNYDDLCDYMMEQAGNGEYIVAALFYDGANELLKRIIGSYVVDLEFVELYPPMYNGYEREFYVSVDEDFSVTVEPAYRNGRYLDTDADELLVDGDANSRIILDVGRDDYCEISIGADDLVDDNFLNSLELVKSQFGNIIGIRIKDTEPLIYFT